MRDDQYVIVIHAHLDLAAEQTESLFQFHGILLCTLSLTPWVTSTINAILGPIACLEALKNRGEVTGRNDGKVGWTQYDGGLRITAWATSCPPYYYCRGVRAARSFVAERRRMR